MAGNIAQERLTLKHKNSSKWAKRILQRGLNIQDDGTRAAIAEQLNQHALLTRKMNSMMGSSDESSDEDYSDDILIDSDQEGPSTMLKKAKEKTLEILEGNEELPKSGVLSLPFMVTLFGSLEIYLLYLQWSNIILEIYSDQDTRLQICIFV